MTRLHPITVLVLAELGLGAGCKRIDAHASVPGESSTDSLAPAASTSASAAPEPSATPVATATPTIAASAPSPPVEPVHRKCTVATQCPKGQRCMLPHNGHERVPGPGQCWTGPMPGGRPLLVEGIPYVAAPSSTTAWSHADLVDERLENAAAWAHTLRTDAFAEHASIPAFARTLCQLLALGAPAWLIEKTSTAMHDEIRHARDCFAWATRLGGVPVGPGVLPEAAAPIDCSMHTILRDVIRGGCIGETLAACTAYARATADPVAELRALYRTIADDEARHAALAFETVRWLVGLDPSARSVVDEERERFYAEAAAEDIARVAPMLAIV